DVADDQWLAFMTAQRAARLCPGELQILDVLGVDVFQGAVARLIEISCRRTPLSGILEARELFGIRSGRCHPGGTQKRCSSAVQLDSMFRFKPTPLQLSSCMGR